MDNLVCSWSGAKKACLRCKSAGHSTSKCPATKPKNQKVGELVNPLQKISRLDKTQKKQKKGSEVLPGNSMVDNPIFGNVLLWHEFNSKKIFLYSLDYPHSR